MSFTDYYKNFRYRLGQRVGTFSGIVHYYFEDDTMVLNGIDTSKWFEISVEFSKTRFFEDTSKEVSGWTYDNIKNDWCCFGDNTNDDSDTLKFRYRFKDADDAIHFKLKWG